jgi:Na+-transporting NADH:ubiquinone oxidoreductase subunit NqrC
MKRTALLLMLLAFFVSCGHNQKNSLNDTVTITDDSSVVNVYYFHGKKRCKTCVAVGDVAKETVNKYFAKNIDVRFIDINTGETGNDELIEKYEVTWNALIVSKGEEFVEITDQAFATAVKNPQSLENLIKEEVDKQLRIIIKN